MIAKITLSNGMNITISEGNDNDLEIVFSRIVDNERDDYLVYLCEEDRKEFFRAITAVTGFYISNFKSR